MTDPAPRTDAERLLAAADAAARHPEPLDRRLDAITPMTAERWDSLAIWQAIAGWGAARHEHGLPLSAAVRFCA